MPSTGSHPQRVVQCLGSPSIYCMFELVKGWCRYDISLEADAMVVFIIFIFLLSGVTYKSHFWPPDTNDAADGGVPLDDNCIEEAVQPSTQIEHDAIDILLTIHRYHNAIRWCYHDIIRHIRRWDDRPPMQHNGVYWLQWRILWYLPRALSFNIDHRWGGCKVVWWNDSLLCETNIILPDGGQNHEGKIHN